MSGSKPKPIPVRFEAAPLVGAGAKATSKPAERTLAAGQGGAGERSLMSIDPEKLGRSLGELTDSLGTALTNLKRVGDYRLCRVEVTVEITAEGGVALLANLKAGAKGAIQLTFEPAP